MQPAQLTAKLIKDGKNRVDNLIGYYRLAAQKKLPRELVMQLVVFLEWIVALPEDLAPYYNEQLEHLEEDNKNSLFKLCASKSGKLQITAGNCIAPNQRNPTSYS